MNTQFLNSVFAEPKNDDLPLAQITEAEASLAAMSAAEASVCHQELESLLDYLVNAENEVMDAVTAFTESDEAGREMAAKTLQLAVLNTNMGLGVIFGIDEGYHLPQVDMESLDIDLESKDQSIGKKILKVLTDLLANAKKWFKATFTQAGRMKASFKELREVDVPKTVVGGRSFGAESKSAFGDASLKDVVKNQAKVKDMVAGIETHSKQIDALAKALHGKGEVSQELMDLVSNLQKTKLYEHALTFKGPEIHIQNGKALYVAGKKPTTETLTVDFKERKDVIKAIETNFEMIDELEKLESKLATGKLAEVLSKAAGWVSKEYASLGAIIRYDNAIYSWLIKELYSLNVTLLSVLRLSNDVTVNPLD